MEEEKLMFEEREDDYEDRLICPLSEDYCDGELCAWWVSMYDIEGCAINVSARKA